jgi:hypothetical protein
MKNKNYSFLQEATSQMGIIFLIGIIIGYTIFN